MNRKKRYQSHVTDLSSYHRLFSIAREVNTGMFLNPDLQNLLWCGVSKTECDAHGFTDQTYFPAYLSCTSSNFERAAEYWTDYNYF